tara:strand:+ start:480 stop:1205 length:726 start_codon:yes stop_codon:yes gene_type:complete
MDNAFENENLENQGQVNDNVGQDNSQTQNDKNTTDWEATAKYMQSEKDKLHAENQKLKEYEKVGQLLESRPDIVNTITGMMQGGQPTANERIAMDKDEFDPWEAYNDPTSKSYKFRQQELQDSINNAVQSQVAGVQKEVGMTKLQTELAAKGLTPEEITSFVDFASKNPAEYGVDGAINMWRAVTQQPAQDENGNPLDVVRQNQAVPQQAGILSGEQPVRKSDDDAVWEGILKAGSRANVL